MNTTDTEQTTTKRTADGARVDPLSPGVARTLIALLVLVAIASFSLSAMGLAKFAETQMGVSAGMSWLLPVAVDAGILVFGLGVIVNRARGESAILPWVCLIGATIISAGANALKVLLGAPGHGDLGWAGPTMAAIVPVILLASTEVLIRAVIQPVQAPSDPAADRPEQITVTRTDTTPIQAAEPAAIHAGDPTPRQTAEPAAQQDDAPTEPAVTAPTPIRRTTTPTRKAAPNKAKRPAPTASLLPEDRVAEAEQLIAEATEQGLSAQRAANWASEQMGLPGAVTKSRVTRWRKENATPAAQAA